MKISALLIITILILFSCDQGKFENDKSKLKENSNLDFFTPADLGAFGSKTRLIIYADFDECGEWGGHHESFEIFSKKDKKFYAKYIRTKVDCKKLKDLYGKPEFQQPYIEKVLELNNKNIIAITDYLSTLMKSKFEERFPGNSGQLFGAIKTDSTFKIEIYDINVNNLNNYNKLLYALDLEIVKFEYE